MCRHHPNLLLLNSSALSSVLNVILHRFSRCDNHFSIIMLTWLCRLLILQIVKLKLYIWYLLLLLRESHFCSKEHFTWSPVETQEARVQLLGWEDPLEKGMATYSIVLEWEIPGQTRLVATVHGVTKSRTQLST